MLDLNNNNKIWHNLRSWLQNKKRWYHTITLSTYTVAHIARHEWKITWVGAYERRALFKEIMVHQLTLIIKQFSFDLISILLTFYTTTQAEIINLQAFKIRRVTWEYFTCPNIFKDLAAQPPEQDFFLNLREPLNSTYPWLFVTFRLASQQLMSDWLHLMIPYLVD